MKKIIASILFICILVTSMTVTGFAAYENTHKQTGNQADDLIAVAQTQLGYREGANANDLSGNTSFRGDGNYTKYGAWYGINPGGMVFNVCFMVCKSGRHTNINYSKTL